MEPKLAAQFPMIKTYQGRGIDDSGATVRFDWSPLGFHALILSSKHGSVYIDPYPETERGDYISYFKRDYRREDAPFQCLVDRKLPAQNLSGSQLTTSLSDSKLRIYRLAVAADSNFTKYSFIKYSGSRGGAEPAGTVETAMSAIATIVNRVNAIYKRDVAVFFKLVGDEQGRSIIFSDPMDDPFYDKSTQSYLPVGAMASKNQEVLDTKIGAGNYDIGHVLGRGGSSEGVTLAPAILLCHDGKKALSGTIVPSPSRIIPDEVHTFAHELGHQLGAEHTYNDVSNKCGGQRVGEFAVEPGSGSTIMSYAGRCRPQQLQQVSDDYFHIISIEQMRGFITSDSYGKCGTSQDTGKAPPSVIAGPAISIPKGTPFTLAAFGSEAALDYCWEECDLGLDMPSGPDTPLPDTDADGKPRPIFRSFKPEPNPTRTFPRMDDLLSGVPGTGEALPTITREMVFKVTVRDNHINGGGVASGATRVIVDASTGPLVVTQPAKGRVWEGGSTQIVKWNVARTDTLAERVHVLLSTDGGRNFDRTLAFCTRNDGEEAVKLPEVDATAARIRVESCVRTSFFNISESFSICAGPRITVEPADVIACAGKPATFSVTAAGAELRYQWYRNGAPIGGATERSLPITAVGAGDYGSYHVVISNGCSSVNSRSAKLSAAAATVITGQLASVTVCPNRPATLSITATGAGLRYQWYHNSVPITSETGSSLTVAATGSKDTGMYHVLVSGDCGSVLSNPATLSLEKAPVITGEPANVEVCAGQPVTFSVTATGTDLRYQWRKNGIPIAGETRRILTVTSVSAASVGSYDVIVTNACGQTDTSRKAALALSGAITITSHPQTVSACLGQSVTFSVNATGGNLRYFWRKNGVNIPGANGSSFTIPAVSAGDTGPYSVWIYNACDQKLSATATLNVNPAAALSPAGRAIGSVGGTGVVSLRSLCSWTAASNAAWITITSPASGSGNGEIAYKVAPNTGPARSGAITVAGQTFTITQAAFTAP